MSIFYGFFDKIEPVVSGAISRANAREAEFVAQSRGIVGTSRPTISFSRFSRKQTG